MSRLPYIVGGGIAFFSGISAAFVFGSKPKKCPPSVSEDSRLAAFTSKASTYDSHVDKTEGGLIDIIGLRKDLCSKANGVVLELAAGTGRNLQFYRAADRSGTEASPQQQLAEQPSGVRRLILLDFAPAMLDVAKSHAADLKEPLPPLEWIVGDAHALPLADATVDTVVDTFGLCSLRDPAQALREAARVVKPGGQILLLEHGRSSWDIVNFVLDRHASAHLHEWGCEWNRDPVAIVRQAGLKIHSCKRKHLGTTYVIVACRPPEGAVAGPSGGPSGAAAKSGAAGPGATTTSAARGTSAAMA